jgi:hypothetical protein
MTLGAENPMPAAVQHVLTAPDHQSALVEDCAGYVAGYVCCKLIERSVIGCGECIGALLWNDEDHLSCAVMSLIEIRDRGGGAHRSTSVYVRDRQSGRVSPDCAEEVR